MIHNMIDNIKLIVVLALITFGAGQARADVTYGQIIYESSADLSGALYFYTTAADAYVNNGNSIKCVSVGNKFTYTPTTGTLTDNMVYITANAYFGYTGLGATITVEKSGSSDIAQTRSRAADVPIRSIPVTAVNGMPGIYCFEMPADGMNVYVTAKFEALPKTTVSYIDPTKEGDAQNCEVEAYVLDGTLHSLGKHDALFQTASNPDTRKPYETWYVCNDELTYNRGLGLYGDVHLILADGKTMSLTTQDDDAIVYSDLAYLTIYGQSLGTGALSATVEPEIGSLSHDGIQVNDLTINGGKVSATGIHATGDIIINGGQVTAASCGEDQYGMQSVSGDIILGWTAATDYITSIGYYCKNYNTSGKVVKTADGRVLKYGGENVVKLMGTLSDAQRLAIADEKLTPYGIYGYCGTTDVNSGQNVMWEIPLDDATTDIDESKTLAIKPNPIVTGQTNFDMADYANATDQPWNSFRSDITTVVIGNGVTTVGQKAFFGCGGLTTVNIPASVTSIGAEAFGDCANLTSIDVDANNANYTNEDGVLFNKAMTTLIQYPVGNNETVYTIPASVQTIGDNAFANSSNLTTVYVLPTTVPTLGDDVFEGCNNGSFVIIVPAAEYGNYSASGWSSYQSKLKNGYTVTCTDGITASGVGPLVQQGETVTLSGTGDVPVGCHFDNYSVKDADYGDVTVTETSGVYTFTMPAADVTVSEDWKENYIITLKSEYSSVPTIYAGVSNDMTVTVTNNSGADAQNVAVTLLIGEEVIGCEEIASLEAGATETLNFTDPTIRPITENTINGNDNENAVYTVSVEENGVEQNIDEFSFVILYNGNLGKDYAYPGPTPFRRDFTFIGDVVVSNGNKYMKSQDTFKDEDLSVDLGDGTVYQALLYVPYGWEGPDYGDFTTWNTTFNDKTVAPIAYYCDQGNLGKYGNRRYGVVVYDVTALVGNGDNTFHLEKNSGSAEVYPSSMIVMTDNPSSTKKTVYIVEEADLLSKSNNIRQFGIRKSHKKLVI